MTFRSSHPGVGLLCMGDGSVRSTDTSAVANMEGRDSMGDRTIPIESFSWSQFESADGASNGEYVLSQVSHSATDESGTQYAEVGDIDLSLSAVDMGGTSAPMVEYSFLLVA